MKPTILMLVLAFLSFTGFSQQAQECSADVTALQDQIKLLAEQLGDKELVEEITAAQEEVLVEQKLEEFETQKITLSEKDPNPYAIEQELTFDIPESAVDVRLIFSNSLGQDIKTVQITERGESNITVYMSEYMLGNYSYSLIVDGTPLDS